VDFENTFAVKAPIDEVYTALLDLERVAPAMPGAQVLEKLGDERYKVAIKVKLGPVSMTYRGEVAVVERDPEAHTAKLDVKAKEARGQGTATATVDMALAEEGGQTAGTMKAHVQLSGKAAAMGRGVIQDVSSRLVQQFADNLEGIVGAPDAAPEEAAEEAPATAAAGDGKPGAEAGEPAGAAATAGAKPAGGPEAAPPRPKATASSGDDALPVGPLVAGMVADRLRDPKVLAAVLGGAVALGYALGRRGG
jgi:carbon monoxide dehydrogenase subunit G